MQTGAVPAARVHPVRGYFDAGVAVTLNTDNRLVSGTSLTDEYWLAHRELRFTWPELVEIARTGFRSAFLEAAGANAWGWTVGVGFGGATVGVSSTVQ